MTNGRTRQRFGAIRKASDDNPESIGEFYLTGSTIKHLETPHTGTGRISEVIMYPMSLWETGESNGSISLLQLFDDKDYSIDGKHSQLSLSDLFYAASRGGWPRCMAIKDEVARLEIAKDYFRQIYQKDVIAIDGVARNSELVRTILWSYARNIATMAKKKNIC